jgi:hypothetical protein
MATSYTIGDGTSPLAIAVLFVLPALVSLVYSALFPSIILPALSRNLTRACQVLGIAFGSLHRASWLPERERLCRPVDLERLKQAHPRPVRSRRSHYTITADYPLKFGKGDLRWLGRRSAQRPLVASPTPRAGSRDRPRRDTSRKTGGTSPVDRAMGPIERNIGDLAGRKFSVTGGAVFLFEQGNHCLTRLDRSP